MIMRISLTFIFTIAILFTIAQSAIKAGRYNAIEVGNLKGNRLQIDSFKAQKELRLTNGLNLHYVTIFFSGANFQNTMAATLAGNSLSLIKNMIDRCKPGTIVSFERIIALNSKGDTVPVKEKIITFYSGTANSDTLNKISENHSFFKSIISHQFISGTIYFSGTQFPNVIIISKKDFPSLQNHFGRCAAGSIITFENCIYKNPDGTLSKPLTKTIKLD